MLSLSTSIFTACGHLTHVFLVDTCQTYVFTNLLSFHWPRYHSLIAKQQGEQQADPLPEAHKNATQDGHSNHLKRSKSHRTQTGDQQAMIHYKIEDHEHHQCIIIHRSLIHTHIYIIIYNYNIYIYIFIYYGCINIYIYIIKSIYIYMWNKTYRRKFRSQTSDNMDR